LPKALAFKHIPMQDIPSRVAELNPDAALAVLCHHGTRSLHVGHFLAQRGFAELANVHGGIDAWSQGADPSVARY
jgi:rhodanese-related sulfurtransferase